MQLLQCTIYRLNYTHKLMDAGTMLLPHRYPRVSTLPEDSHTKYFNICFLDTATLHLHTRSY